MRRLDQLYEGKAKRVYRTDDESLLVVEYKDDATALNGQKRGVVAGKGVINNRMSNALMRYLERNGVPTHLVEELSDRETLVRAVQIIPLEVIVRNVAAGSFAKRCGVDEGRVLERPTIEFSYKNDELSDPLINAYHAKALGLASDDEIDAIKRLSFRINDLLRGLWLSCGITLVDFKLEFGRTGEGAVILADEISPDTSRLWDAKTGEKLDKDRFRRDLGGVEEAYAEAMRRVRDGLERGGEAL